MGAVLLGGVLGCAPTAAARRVETAPSGTAPSGTAPVAPFPAQAVIPVAVTYVLRSMQPAMDSLFPVSDSLTAARCANAAGLVCHQYVYRREALVMQAEQARLRVSTQLSYRARVGLPGAAPGASCGFAPEPMRRADLSMQTALYWRRDWRIGARETQLAAQLRDPCRVTALGLNATGAMQAVVDRQLAAFAAEADTLIPQVADFRPLADSLWRSFLEPTALDSTNSLWLLMEPTGVQVTPFVGTGPAITTSMVLYAQPRVIAGAKPVVRMRPLPPLTLGTAPAGFVVPVTVELPYAEIERQATALLVADTRRDAVKIDTVRLTARGDSVFVDVDVSGALRGTLGMTSQLRWDAAARELRLDQLRWSLASEGKLARAKATLAAPLIGLAVRRATSGGRIALGMQLDSVRTEMLTLLNGAVAPGVVMGTSVQPVQVQDVLTTPRAFVVRAILQGQSGVWIQ